VDEIAALLTEKPVDVDYSLFENTPEIKFIKDFQTKYGILPEPKVFEREFNIELPTALAPWDFYVTKLKEEKFIKDAIPALTHFNEEYDKDQKRALLELREKLMQIVEPTTGIHYTSITEDLSRFERFKSTDNTRILTGIKPLDDLSGGVSKKDEFMIVTARLGVGKSWVALAIAANMCINGHKVAVYSGEMTSDEVGARIDTFISHISNFGITRGKNIDLTEHFRRLQEINETTGRVYVLHPSNLGRNAQPSDIKRFVKDVGAEVVVIDQISLMKPDGRASLMWSTADRVAELSLQLKTLQQELQIPLIAVNQLNRGAAQQEADASNLSGSDRLGQDATLIVSLKKKDDLLRMKVLKSRSFRTPEEPFEFTWDIDKGIIEPRLSAMDAVKAKVQQGKAREASKEIEDIEEGEQPAVTRDEDDEIW